MYLSNSFEQSLCLCRTHFHSGSHYLFAHSEVFRWEFICSETEGHHVGEDVHHGVVTEGVDAADVEVAQEARRHSVPPTTRGTHG